MDVLLITNNDKVRFFYEKEFEIDYLESGTYLEVLYRTRDYIHLGWRLLSHPMAGSVKPNQTPYRTVMLGSKSKGERNDESILLIESSIEAAKKFQRFQRTPNWNQKIKEDFKTVDLSFVQGFASKVRTMLY